MHWLLKQKVFLSEFRWWFQDKLDTTSTWSSTFVPGYEATSVQSQTGTRLLIIFSNPLPSLPATLSCFAVILSVTDSFFPTGVLPFFCDSFLNKKQKQKQTNKTPLSFWIENMLFPHHFIFPPHKKPEHCSSPFGFGWDIQLLRPKNLNLGKLSPRLISVTIYMLLVHP